MAAGLVVATMLVPSGIAYATASGLPASGGLYASMLPLLAYAAFGPSRIFVLGPDSSLTALILAVVLPVAAGDPAKAIAVGGLMAVVAGLLCILGGLLRIGFITELLSKPIRYGYMNGIAFALLVSQLPKLLGIRIDASGPFRNLVSIAQAVAEGRVHPPTLAIGAGTLLLLFLFRRLLRIPGILLAVAAATIAVTVFGLAAHGVAVIGPMPRGLPSLTLPWLGFAQLVPILAGGAAVALVAFADTSVLSRTYAARSKRDVDPNQELIALGAANLASGLFQGFPISSSSSRTPVAESAGARTQLTGIVGALAIALLLVAAPNLLRNLPHAALAAIVIGAAIGILELRDLGRIWRIQRGEFWLSMACFAGVVGLGAIPGIGVAVGIAILEFLWDAWRPYSAVLGQVEGLRGFHDVSRHPEARRVPGLVLFRWDAPLFFANAEWFVRKVRAAIAESPTAVRRVVVAAEPVTGVDVTSADALVALVRELSGRSIELRFAELKGPVKDTLRRFEVFDALGGDLVYRTVGEAVDDYITAGPIAETRPESGDPPISTRPGSS